MADNFNSLATQSLVAEWVAYNWEAQEGFADYVDEPEKDFVPKAVNNTGYSVSLRRPSRVETTVTTTNVNYALPGVTQPPVGYSAKIDATLPFTIGTRLEVNLQTSMEELIFKLTKGQDVERHVSSALISLRDKANLILANLIEAGSSATLPVSTTGFAADPSGFMTQLFNAEALLSQRGALPDGKGSKSILFNNTQIYKVGVGNAGTFHADGSGKAWERGEFAPLAGFNVYKSGLLPVIAGALAIAGITVQSIPTTGNNSVSTQVSPTGGLPFSWQQFTDLVLTGFTNNQVIPAGLTIKFANSGVAVNWCNATTFTDTTYAATFKVVSASAGTAPGGTVGQADVNGKLYVTVTEPIIPRTSASWGSPYTGTNSPFANVTADIVAGTTVSVVIPQTGTSYIPNYVFTDDAIVMYSPEVKIDRGAVYSQNIKVGNWNIALIEDRWPGTFQNITKAVMFLGAAIQKPEGIIKLI
jgi:hypothetical protein